MIHNKIRAPATRPCSTRRAFGGNRRLYTLALVTKTGGPPSRPSLGCVEVIAPNLVICPFDQGLMLCPREEVASIFSLQRAHPIKCFFVAAPAHCQLGPFPMKTQWRCSHHQVDLWCDLSTGHVLALWCDLSLVWALHLHCVQDVPRSLARWVGGILGLVGYSSKLGL